MRRGWYKSICLTASCVLGFLVVPAGASPDSGGTVFEIPAQPVNKALQAYSRQSGLRVVYRSRSAREPVSRPVAGHHSAEQALKLLLSGSDLSYKFITESTVVVQRRRADARPPGGPGHASENSDDDYAIEEMVVIAQHWPEELQKVPLSISALSADAMHRSGIDDLYDVSVSVPGLTFASFNLGQPTIHIRGIGSNDDGAGLDNSTVAFVDGVYVGRISMIDFDLFDLERVEVLRGPQGTLYGKNAIGGAINIISKRPARFPEGALELTAGSLALRRARGRLGGPLSNNWSAKASFNLIQRDGYQTNLLTGAKQHDQDRASARLQAQWSPIEGREVLFGYEHFEDDLAGTGRVAVAGLNRPAFERNSPGPRFALNDEPGFTDRTMRAFSVNGRWETGYGTWASISGYRRSDFATREDSTGLHAGIGPAEGRVGGGEIETDVLERVRQFSQEIRLASDDRLQRAEWVIGGFYLYEDVRRREAFPIVLGVGRDPNPFDKAIDQRNVTHSQALFGEFHYQLTDRFGLLAGARYTHESKRLTQHTEQSPGSPPLLISEEFAVSQRIGFDNLSGKLGFKYGFDNGNLCFATVTQGFKSGGFQGVPGTLALATTPVREETAVNYELGCKSQWFDDRYRVNLTVFHTDYRDLQVVQFVPEAGFGNFLTSNAANADLDGAELEFIARPLRGLEIKGFYAYLDARYQGFVDVRGRDFSGNALRQAPRHTANLSVSYDVPVALPGRLNLTFDYRYQHESFREPDNSITRVPAYDVANARLSYAPEHGKWELALRGRNIFDELYIDHIYTLGGTDYALFASPRTFELSFAWYYF